MCLPLTFSVFGSHVLKVHMDVRKKYPSYLNLYESGELNRRAEVLAGLLEACRVCPRECGADRLRDEYGSCRSGMLPVVASSCPHFGEEPVLVGERGSGTIFFGSCNLRCIFCQNHDISQRIYSPGRDTIDEHGLARIMIALQNRGCHNINFVSPTHFVPQIIKALLIAIPEGLSIPLVYNSNGYDSLEVLRLLDGIIDIYLPDIKYSDNAMALKYSGVGNYVENSRLAIAEMFRQVGVLETDSHGIARRGLIVRHLVLPNGIAGTSASLEFIADNLSRFVTVSLMAQYHPTFRAREFPELNRFLSRKEYEEAVSALDLLRMENGWAQDLVSRDIFLPDFNKVDPFGR